jgi:hypothetical protein
MRTLSIFGYSVIALDVALLFYWLGSGAFICVYSAGSWVMFHLIGAIHFATTFATCMSVDAWNNLDCSKRKKPRDAFVVGLLVLAVCSTGLTVLSATYLGINYDLTSLAWRTEVGFVAAAILVSIVSFIAMAAIFNGMRTSGACHAAMVEKKRHKQQIHTYIAYH